MNTNTRIAGALLSTLVFLGCKETTSSEFIHTNGISARMEVTAESSDSSTVHVDLLVAQTGAYIRLDGGDKLTARAGTETKDLYSIDEGVYEGTFATAGQVQFTVGLDRSEDVDAPASTATLPASFMITSPEPADALSRASDGLLIVWTVVQDVEGTITVSGSCIESQSFTVSGTAGMQNIGPGQLKSSNQTMPESCTVDVAITFSKDGTADPALNPESYFTATQSRRTSFTSNP